MTFLVADRVKETSTTTGTGTLTLAGAVAGFQAFSVIGNANVTHYTLLDANGTGWEVGIGTYTLSGTTLARTTILASSAAGAAITLSAGTHTVFCGMPAAIGGQLMTATNLVTGGDAATTMVANATYVVAMSAWATADRIYTLPAAPTVGDRVSIVIQSGNASFELIVKGNTSQTINGGSAASEWSRLFITGESVTLRYVATNTWIVEVDDRIPMTGVMNLTTAATGETAGTLTYPTVKGGAWTITSNIGDICATATDKLTARRACKAVLGITGLCNSVITGGFLITLESNGGGAIWPFYIQAYSGAATVGLSGGRTEVFALDDYVRYQYFTSQGSRGLYGGADHITSMSFAEVL